MTSLKWFTVGLTWTHLYLNFQEDPVTVKGLVSYSLHPWLSRIQSRKHKLIHVAKPPGNNSSVVDGDATTEWLSAFRLGEKAVVPISNVQETQANKALMVGALFVLVV